MTPAERSEGTRAERGPADATAERSEGTRAERGPADATVTAVRPVDPDADSLVELDRVAELVRSVPDYPRPGVLFRDITPVLADGEAFATVATEMAARAGEADVVVGVEARGFLLGGAVALVAGVGTVPVRKAGKLPAVAASRTYELEYGTATLELPADVVAPGTRVYVVDDVLATGGTAAAACALLAEAGAEIVGFGTMLELPALNGRARLDGIRVDALLAG